MTSFQTKNKESKTGTEFTHKPKNIDEITNELIKPYKKELSSLTDKELCEQIIAPLTEKKSDMGTIISANELRENLLLKYK